MKAETLFFALDKTLADQNVNTITDTLADVKAEAIDDTFDYALEDVKAQKLSDNARSEEQSMIRCSG